MEESVKSRTIEFVKAKGIKMKVFEERCGLSSGYVTSMRKGFGPDKLTGVLKAFPELNRNWLLYGEGKMLAAEIDTPKETIAEALGHSIATVTDIYIKFNRRKIDEANRRVIDLLK